MHLVYFHIPQNRGLYAAIGKIKTRPVAFRYLLSAMFAAVAMLNLRRRKPYRSRIPVRGESVNNRPSGVAQPQQLRNLIERLARRIVSRVPDIFIRPAAFAPNPRSLSC